MTVALEAQLVLCASNTAVELQERGAELSQLLDLVKHGLDAPRPTKSSPSNDEGFDSNGAGDDPYAEPEETGGFASTSKAPPRCLTLLSPLFFSHELNPVNPKAQSLVAIPEGLDLDASVVPRMSMWIRDELELGDGEGEVDEYGRPIGKAKLVVDEEDVGRSDGKRRQGKGKAVSSKQWKRKEDDPKELARVRHLTSYLLLLFPSLIVPQTWDR